MIEVVQIDDYEVSLFGDYDVTLLEVEGGGDAAAAQLRDAADVVTIVGENLGGSASTINVSIGSSACEVVTINHTNATCEALAGAGG